MKKLRFIFFTAALVCVLFIFSGCDSSNAASSESVNSSTTVVTAIVTSTAVPVQLTAQQMSEIQNYLCDPVNNGFILWNEYTRPEEVNLWKLFYDNTGVEKILSPKWSEQERIDIQGAADIDRNYPIVKMRRADVDAFLLKKLGISSASFEEWICKDLPMPLLPGTVAKPGRIDLYYSEKYDAYYFGRGDDYTIFPVEVSGGQIIAKDIYVINYRDKESPPGYSEYTVKLRKTDDGYQFISNIKK